MKIPFPDQPAVATTALATPFSNVNANGANDGLANGLGKVEGAVADGVSKYDEEQRQVKARADAISQANADAAYQRGETADLVGGSNRNSLIENAFNGTGPAETLTPANVQDTPGFLSTRGMAASEQSASVLDRAEKRRQQIAKDYFADPEARDRWLARSDGMLADTQRKVEMHAATQFGVAAQDALKGKKAAGLDAIATSTDPTEISRIGRDGEAAIRQLQVSKEGGDAEVQQWWSDVAKTHISSLLTDGQIGEARAAFNGSKVSLGTEAPRVDAMIDQAEKSRERDAKTAQNETDASQIVKNATPAGGYVDENRALAQVEALPPEVRGEVRTQVLHQLTVQAQAKKNDIEDWKTTAYSAFNRGGLGAVKGDLLNRLNRYDPAFVDKLKSESEARWRRAKADLSGDAAARREQANINRLALSDYRGLSQEDRATTDVDTFLAGRGVDQLGASVVKQEKRKTEDMIRRGDSVAETQFVQLAEAKAKSQIGTDKNKAKDFKAQAVQAFGQLYEEAKGKPTSKQVEEETDRLVTNAVTQPRFLESLRGKGEEPEWQRRAREQAASSKTVAPAAKPISAYAYSPDKKQRRPRYADGTLGPTEQVP